MRLIALAFAAAIFSVTAIGTATLGSSEAHAQATCRNKCNNQEQACLKRTNNKSQCGRKAQACMAKCK
jgi:hypothetical protein